MTKKIFLTIVMISFTVFLIASVTKGFLSPDVLIIDKVVDIINAPK